MHILKPMTIKKTVFRNKVVMAPMCMYSVFNEDGKVTPFHQTHYVTRAIGGVGFIILESTATMPQGRLSPFDLGLWSDEHIEGLKKIVDEVHQYGGKIGIQVNHAGRKAKLDGRIIAPSSLRYTAGYSIPDEMTIDDINAVIKSFGDAARRADEAGFDALEIHGAHGYLINQFISPITNKRTDHYQDGAVFLKEIMDEVKKYWPKEKILQIRISAYEYLDDGITPYDWAAILNNFKNDFDLVNISSGGIIPIEINDYPGYHLPYAQIIKEETGMRIMAGGQIDDIELANRYLEEAGFEMFYFGRLLLKDPYVLYRYDEDLIVTQYQRLKLLKKGS